jgi:hypothetical protein
MMSETRENFAFELAAILSIACMLFANVREEEATEKCRSRTKSDLGLSLDVCT